MPPDVLVAVVDTRPGGVTGRGTLFRQVLERAKKHHHLYTTGLLLAVNWLPYIWAVNARFIVEANLGYFINPLINVFFVLISFREKMRWVQWLALLLACCGVTYLTVFYGQFPWIALGLATCFGIYGLLHKKNSLGALDGLCLETGILFLPATAVLIGLASTGAVHLLDGIDLSGLIAPRRDRCGHHSTVTVVWLRRA